MKYALLVFAATWLSVFTLGLQTLNVNQGHYIAAATTSVLISSGSLLILRYVPTAGWFEIAGYYLGGVTGITSSMWFHRRAKAGLQLQRARWKARRTVSRRQDEHEDIRYCGAFRARNLDVTGPHTDVH